MLRSIAGKVGQLGFGIIVGQGAVLLATPVLARTHTPAEFGVLALFLLASNVAAGLGAARYDFAIASCAASRIAPLSIICSFIATTAGFVTFIIINALPTFKIDGSVVEALVANDVALALCVSSSALLQIASAILLRRGKIRFAAGLRASQGVAFAFIALSGASTLAWAHTMSFIAGPMLMGHFVLTHGRQLKWTSILAAAHKFVDFPRHGLPGAILDTIGYSLCVWIVIEVYGMGAGGEWSQVQRLVGAPLMVLSIALGQVLLVQIPAYRRDRPALRRALLRLSLAMSALGLIMIFLLVALGEQLFGLILGDQWRISKAFLVALSLAVFVRAAVSPLSAVLTSFRRLDLALRWQGLYFLSAALLFYAAASQVNIETFAFFYAAHETILYCIYLFIIYRALKD